MQRLEERLVRIESQVERGNRDGPNAGRAFSIFAVCALVLAMATLFAVLADNNGSSAATTTARADDDRRGAERDHGHAGERDTCAGAGGAEHRRQDARVLARPRPGPGSAGLVRFTVRNAGAINHEFVVLRTDKQAGSLLKGGEADERGNVGEIGDLPPGSAKTLALRLKAGHYALICDLPGHYAAGQHSDFTVR